MDLKQVLRAIQSLASNPELRQSAMEAFADAAAELWPFGPPPPHTMSDEEFTLVINRAVENLGE